MARPRTNNDELHRLTVDIPVSIWKKLRRESFETDKSIRLIVIEAILTRWAREGKGE